MTTDRLDVTTTARGLRIPIRVIPRSPRNRIDGVRAGRLLVRVTAPPVDAAANEAVIALLAETLSVPRRNVQIVSGATSRNKTIEVNGIEDAALRSALSAG
jgi:uncharacterized protein (TIGR00251 family)